MLTDLDGHIENIIYSNTENGYAIIKLKSAENGKSVTVVGNIASPAPGQMLSMKGEWITHPKFGKQFKVTECTATAPSSIQGIEKYLGSGLIKGLGPAMAERIVKTFGKDTIDIIENDTDRLEQVEGIGKRRIVMIKEAWKEQQDIRDLMIFLQSHSSGAAQAIRIYREYGTESIRILKENPYRLATDLTGVGFLTADNIAGRLGFPMDSVLRIEAGILYVMEQLLSEGNVYYPYDMLVKRSRGMLKINDLDLIERSIESISTGNRLVVEDINGQTAEDESPGRAVYLSAFYSAEKDIAERLKKLRDWPESKKIIDSETSIIEVQKDLGITLAKRQKEAVKCALEKKLMVITGGPGTGKSTIINAVIRIFARQSVNIMLAAPTGRAAKRMNEITGFEARTIHRLLEYNVQDLCFKKDENDPLDCDLLIVDEASMIDCMLMHNLLRAVPSRATLILAGDINQLPSVGPGNILKDIISSDAFPVVELNEIFRQARQSLIVRTAHKINSGEPPAFEKPGEDDDYYFIKRRDSEDVVNVVLELVKNRVPDRFGISHSDIQVLTPMHRGPAGTENLNARLQQCLNPREDGIKRGSFDFRVNDRVMQIKNNYDREVFNGDVGKIIRIDREEQNVIVSFDRRSVSYEFSDLDEIMLAYAVSIHKSQGSEYEAVIIPLVNEHYMMLQRNLVYTAVTRGKKLVVMVGSGGAMLTAVKNNKTEKRYTRLAYRLNNSC